MLLVMTMMTTIMFMIYRIAMFKCLVCCFMEERNLFGSGRNGTQRNKFLAFNTRMSLWTVRAPLRGYEFPVADGLYIEPGSHWQRRCHLRAGKAGLNGL